jgi:hypothetical protein
MKDCLLRMDTPYKRRNWKTENEMNTIKDRNADNL